MSKPIIPFGILPLIRLALTGELARTNNMQILICCKKRQLYISSSLSNCIYPCISEYSNSWSNIACARENIRYLNWRRPFVTRSIYYLGVLLSEEISITLYVIDNR